MNSNWWLNVLSGLEVATLATSVLLIIQKGLVRKWPMLTTTLAIELLRNVALVALLGRHGIWYKYYFFIYWGGLALLCLLRLGVIADIVRAFRGIDFLPWQIYSFVGIAGVTMAIASGVYCYHNSGPVMWKWEIATAFLLNQCVCIAWGTFVASMLISFKLFNIAWELGAARVANGFFFRICVSMVTAEMFTSKVRSIRLTANGLDSLAAILVFGFWTYFLLVYNKKDSMVADDESPIAERNALELLALCSSRVM